MHRTAALALALAAAAAGAAADEVKPYTSTQWGFSARFPFAVVEKPQSRGVIVSAGNADDTIAYMVMVSSIDAEVLKAKTRDQILDEAVKAAADNVRGTVTGKRAATLDGHPGRDATISAGGMSARVRAFVVGNRLYMPLMIASPDLKAPLSADEFHASFKLLAGK